METYLEVLGKFSLESILQRDPPALPGQSEQVWAPLDRQVSPLRQNRSRGRSGRRSSRSSRKSSSISFLDCIYEDDFSEHGNFVKDNS